MACRETERTDDQLQSLLLRYQHPLLPEHADSHWTPTSAMRLEPLVCELFSCPSRCGSMWCLCHLQRWSCIFERKDGTNSVVPGCPRARIICPWSDRCRYTTNTGLDVHSVSFAVPGATAFVASVLLDPVLAAAGTVPSGFGGYKATWSIWEMVTYMKQ
jgi:hypothetical protein